MFKFLAPLVAFVVCVEICAPQVIYASPAQPGGIERTIPAQVQSQGPPPAVSLPTKNSQQESWQTRPFTLAAVNIYGTTVFSQAQLSRYFEPYLATEVDAGKLSKIADAITNHYRQEGYLLSYATVPTQTVEAGMVRLNVVEGRIDAIAIDGAGAAQRAIKTIAAALANGAPLRSSDLERVTGLIRDIPGITVQNITVSPSVIAGCYTLRIKVIEHRVRAFSYADNRTTNDVGHGRAYTSFAISSVFVEGDELRGDFFGVPGNRSRFIFGQALATVPVGDQGLRVAICASRGDQYLRSSEHFRGVSENVSAQISYPLLRSRVLTLVAKASMTDFRSVGTQSDHVGLRDRFRVGRVGIQFGNESDVTRFAGEVSLSRGLGFGGMTRVGDPLASRPDAGGEFTKVAFTVDVAHALSQRFTLRGVAAAQYSDRPLLSGEEFSLGGNRIGRAFDFNALTGDEGAGAGVELGYRLGAGRPTNPEVFGFLDAGKARNLSSATSRGGTYSLASAGVGVRLKVVGATISLEADMPLSGSRHSPHLFASILRSF